MSAIGLYYNTEKVDTNGDCQIVCFATSVSGRPIVSADLSQVLRALSYDSVQELAKSYFIELTEILNGLADAIHDEKFAIRVQIQFDLLVGWHLYVDGLPNSPLTLTCNGVQELEDELVSAYSIVPRQARSRADALAATALGL